MSEGGCCSGNPYQSGMVGRIVGDVWRPGGHDLSARLAFLMKASRDELILDLGCGAGSTARLLSEQYGCKMVGMDVSPDNVRSALRGTGRPDCVSFLAGDGQHAPLADGAFDGVMLECVLSTLQDKPATLGELFRILKPRGRLGLSDVVAEDGLPEDLKSPLMDAFCVGTALSVDGYLSIIEERGFEVAGVERLKREALDFLEQTKRKLFVAKLLTGVGRLSLDLQDLDYAKHLLKLATTAVEQEKLGYVAITAWKRD